MAKTKTIKHESKSKGAHYLILLGVIVLLVGLVVIYAHHIKSGVALLIIGILIAVLGLSQHSLHLLKRKAGKR
jgi:uncharacterized membrane protein HdeD (DUF308 family)